MRNRSRWTSGPKEGGGEESERGKEWMVLEKEELADRRRLLSSLATIMRKEEGCKKT